MEHCIFFKLFFAIPCQLKDLQNSILLKVDMVNKVDRDMVRIIHMISS